MAVGSTATSVSASVPCDDVRMRWNVRIPVKDGVSLGGTLYLPAGQVSPMPALFTLTPYIAQGSHEAGVYFASHGYPFLAVDVRGRGNSDGTFAPNVHDGEDGAATVAWLASQSFCDGQVAMWGGSYAGNAQWATAAELPSGLATVVPVASPCRGIDSPMRSNIFAPYMMQWLTLVGGHTAQEKIFADDDFWRTKFRELFERGLAFHTLDRLVGYPSAIFQEWISHPHLGPFWDGLSPCAEHYAALALPILTITGSYDADQPGALEHYRRHQRYAAPDAAGRHFLVIGPWDHAGTRTPQRQFSGIEVGRASLIDVRRLHLDWYDWTMRGGRRPSFLEKNVTYYVTGAECWRYADTLAKVTAQERTLFLHAETNPSDPFHAGQLSDVPSGVCEPAWYIHDPRDTTTAALEERADIEDLTDQRLVLAGLGRQLIYHSAVFERDVEISGFFRLVAWIAIDQPDTDFRAAVYEIGRDGSSLLLTSDMLRARHRESARAERLIETNDPLSYKFDRFTFVARRIPEGHRLRLVISPVHSIFLQRNFNAGGVVAQETIADARTVTVRLFQDAAHRSALIVPIGAGDGGAA